VLFLSFIPKQQRAPNTHFFSFDIPLPRVGGGGGGGGGRKGSAEEERKNPGFFSIF
jgi:hypothetical protein